MRIRVAPTGCVLLAGLSGCGAQTDLNAGGGDTAAPDVTVLDSGQLRAQSTYQELFLFDGFCPNSADFSQGKVPSAFLRQPITEFGTPFIVSNLPIRQTGFGVLFRKTDCGMVAYGCTDADLTHIKHVDIVVAAGQSSQGVCSTGQSCIQGQCQ